jgi:hypothetical protein
LYCLKNRCRSSHTGQLPAFRIQLWGKSPEIQSMSSTISWKATGSKHDGTGRRMARMIYQKSLFFFGLLVPSRSLCCFFRMVRPSVKARVCEDMSTPVARGFHLRNLLSLLIDTVIRLLNRFMDHQLNGAHSQAVQSYFYIFSTLGTLSFIFQGFENTNMVSGNSFIKKKG